MKSVKDFFRGLLAKWVPTFRDGLEAFIYMNLRAAITVALQLLSERIFNNTDEFVRVLWEELRKKYPTTPGTWLTLLANFALESLKKQERI